MTNNADSEDILTDQEKLKKWQNPNTSNKPLTPKTLQNKKYMPGSEQRGAVLKKNKTRKYSKIDNSPFPFKKSNGPMCLANNGIWLTNIVSQ